MNSKKKVKKLDKAVSKLQKIIKKGKITLKDSNQKNQKVVISFIDGVFSVDKITTTDSTDNISTTLNS
jgi:hypothetical protein